MRTSRLSLITGLVLLSGCGSSQATESEGAASGAMLPRVSGPKAGAYQVVLFTSTDGVRLQARPSGPMGVFISSFIAQGGFVRSMSATQGIDAQMRLLEGQINVESSETFALLKEFGSVLQIDIVDALNRSSDRVQTLDTYLSSLKNITELVERKTTELESVRENVEDEMRQKNKRIRDIERTIKKALDEANYEQAGVEQEELTGLKGEVAALEVEIDQNDDITARYQALIDIAKVRYDALSANRRIVLSGLKVVEVPGIEDFNILDENKRFRASERPFTSGTDPLRFGDN